MFKFAFMKFNNINTINQIKLTLKHKTKLYTIFSDKNKAIEFVILNLFKSNENKFDNMYVNLTYNIEKTSNEKTMDNESYIKDMLSRPMY